MAIDYNDERFGQVQAEKEATMGKVNDTYNGMINSTDSYYNDLKQATEDYEQKQTELQQARTDQMIKEINQNKEQAEKDYLKEQKASYADYAKQTNEYGVNSEQMASAGLSGSGYSESSRVSMYNTYQNRYAIARESYNQAVQNYNNQIAQAELNNNSALAEIAFNSLQKQLELALEGFQYKNTLLTTKLNTELEVDNNYYTRYQDVVNQINTENALAEQIRQYNEQMAYQKERDKVADSQWQAQFNSSKKASASGSGGSSKRGSSNVSGSETGGDSNIIDTGAMDTVEVNEEKVSSVVSRLNKLLNTSQGTEMATLYLTKEFQMGNISSTELDEIKSKLGL